MFLTGKFFCYTEITVNKKTLVAILLVLLLLSVSTIAFLFAGYKKLNSPIALTGVVVPGTFSGKTSACPEGTYLKSSDDSPLVDKQYSLRLVPAPDSGLTDLVFQAAYNQVQTATGVIKRVKCREQNGCDCEDYLSVNSLTLDEEKTRQFSASQQGYAGELTCLYDDENNCIFIMKSILDGKNYELVDMSEQSGLGQFKAGQKIKAYGEIIQGNSFDTATISGSIYLVKAEAF